MKTLEIDERRQHQRIVPEGAMAQIVIGGRLVGFAIDNLSEGGALIAGRTESEAGSIIDLRILLPRMDPFVLPARVLRAVGRDGKDYTALMFLAESLPLESWIGDLVLEGLRAAFPEI